MPQAAYPEVTLGHRAAGFPATSLFGLAPGGVCRAVRVTTCAVRSYRTISPLPAPPLRAARRRYLSVALSVGSRPPGVTWHRVRRSPDFPPHFLRNAAITWPTPVGTIRAYTDHDNEWLADRDDATPTPNTPTAPRQPTVNAVRPRAAPRPRRLFRECSRSSSPPAPRPWKPVNGRAPLQRPARSRPHRPSRPPALRVRRLPPG